LSLGRAEPFPGGWDTAAIERDGVDVVRRPTGGDAVLHDSELTFAVAASIPGPWGLTPRGFADAVAEAVADAMAASGIAAARVGREEADRSTPSPPGAEPCFARAAPGEVRAGGYKVAGIAARFARGGVLCHASVPLTARHRDVARYRICGDRERSLLERHARSLGELLGAAPDSAALGERIAGSIAARLCRRLEPADFEALGIARP